MELAVSSNGSERVETAPFSPPGPAGFELPARYGEDKLVLLVRDPWWLFAYWEVTPGRESQVRHEIGSARLEPERTVLRIYDVTDRDTPVSDAFFDIEVGGSNNWYVDVGRPDRAWVAELGIRTRDGRFFALVRSNRVRTPRFGISDVLDEEWMMPDELYWKLFGLSAGFGKSSLAVQEIMERYLKGLVSSPSSPAIRSRS